MFCVREINGGNCFCLNQFLPACCFFNCCWFVVCSLFFVSFVRPFVCLFVCLFFSGVEKRRDFFVGLFG